MRMNDPTATPPREAEEAPGHYGAGYGEQVPDDAPPQLGPATDESSPSPRDDGDAQPAATTSDAVVTSEGDDGSLVVFTPADVHARPPDHTPTTDAPESEKAGLIFERS
jgi:hypothetical protein